MVFSILELWCLEFILVVHLPSLHAAFWNVVASIPCFLFRLRYLNSAFFILQSRCLDSMFLVHLRYLNSAFPILELCFFDFMFFLCLIYTLSLAPWYGVWSFGTNLHRFQKICLWRQRHLPHRLLKTYQKSFLEEKLHAICGLHFIANWSCFIYVILDLFCRMSTCIFSFGTFLKKKGCIDFMSNANMVEWRENVTCPKRRETWGFRS